MSSYVALHVALVALCWSFARDSHLQGTVTCKGQSLARDSHLQGTVTCKGQSLARDSHLQGIVTCKGILINEVDSWSLKVLV